MFIYKKIDNHFLNYICIYYSINILKYTNVTKNYITKNYITKNNFTR
jgi:hypothetical protein